MYIQKKGVTKLSCPYYTFKDGEYHCVKQHKDVNSDIYYKYCRNYDYDDCPIYKGDSSGGCYLTSACTCAKGLADDCYELQTLRNFRDNWLAKTTNGLQEIAHYYVVAPKIVSAINSQKDSRTIYEKIYNEMVLPCVRFIEQEQYQKAFELYTNMTLSLEKKYEPRRI